MVILTLTANIVGDNFTNITGIDGLTANTVTALDQVKADSATGVGLTVVNDAFIGNQLTAVTVEADNVNSLVGMAASLFNVTDRIIGVTTFAGDINTDSDIVGDGTSNISGINSVTATEF